MVCLRSFQNLLYGVTLMCVVYGVIFPGLLVRTADAAPVEGSCDDMLEPQDADYVKNVILAFKSKWTLLEAYSSDPSDTDQFALTHALSSWAQFTLSVNNRVKLDMAHRLLRPNNRTTWCVYHHFNLTLAGNTLYLTIPDFGASAQMRFLKACNECMAMHIEAEVPGYPTLIYLLVYAQRHRVHDFYLAQTRREAECLNFTNPPAFHYDNGLFCPDDKKSKTDVTHTFNRLFWKAWNNSTDSFHIKKHI